MRKIIYKGLIIIFLILCNKSIGYGQISDFIPPSPNASSLMSLSDITVNEYVGIPNICIPIYTVKSGDIELPINLNYNASGIKVEQEASWVGLGWSLNAGGCITRQIRGQDDFKPSVGYVVTEDLPPSTSDNLPQWGTTNENSEYLRKYANIASGSLDGEPDLFYYNFDGKSGKLIFEKQSGTVVSSVSLSQNNILFSYDWFHMKWEVTDEKGFKYYFGTKEITTNYSWSGSYRYVTSLNFQNAEEVTSSWYLDSIKSPNGFQVNFIYDDKYNRTISQVQRSEMIYDVTEVSLIETNGKFFTSPHLPGSNSQHTAAMQEVDDIYLKEISFDNGKLIFTTGDREDMSSKNSNKPQRLEDMKIYTGSNSSDTLLKTFDFSYSYFNQSNGKTNMMRLKLDSLREIEGSGGISLPSHKFSYNATALPSKTSYSMDHWGYYNGKNNNSIRRYSFCDVKNYLNNADGLPINSILGIATDTTMVPYIEHKQDSCVFFYGADREPDASKMQAEILTKIGYPTGGYAEFEYEPNQYSSTDSLFRDTAYVKSVYFIKYDTLLKERNITLTENTMMCLDYSFRDDIAVPNTYTTAIAVLKRSNGNKIIEFKPNSSEFESHIWVCLPPGNYVLYVDCPDDENDFQEIIAKYKKKIYNKNAIGGGLRVAKITNKDEYGTVKGIEEYEYEDSGVSTGKLMSPMLYFYNETLINLNLFSYPCGWLFCIYQGNYLVRTSNSCIPFGNSAQGNPLGYDKVIKSQVSASGVSNGKIVYYFRNTPEQPVSLPGVPNYIYTDNGYLTKVEDYDRSNNLVKKKMFGYVKNLNYDINVKGVKAYKFCSGSINDNNISSQVIRFYDNKSEWWHPIADTSFVYSSDGSGNYVRTINNYFFDNSNHKLLSRQSTQGSDGHSIVSQTRYPYDINNGIYSSMVSLNMQDYPIEQIFYINGQIVSSSLTKYKLDGDKYVPDEVYTLKSSTPVSPSSFSFFSGSTVNNLYGSTADVTFNSYDNKGNIQQVTGKDGIVTSYLWGYNNTLPIVKAENVSYSTLITAANSAAVSAGSTDIVDLISDIGYLTNSTQITKWKSFNTALRNQSSLQNALVTTYSFRPLTGMTSSTDPTGVTTYYQYDPFGRLEYIKNDDSNLLKRFGYHYAGQ